MTGPVLPPPVPRVRFPVPVRVCVRFPFHGLRDRFRDRSAYVRPTSVPFASEVLTP